ncbi:MAG: MBL fold metallo-hydrolase [Tannerella sp.]|jgi:glyoxylase-like metal-dependent hydrolase (beta-lactamase superfamily II)|nr:MBL fold metallo-hydrolase [Tannerella sp.]
MFQLINTGYFFADGGAMFGAIPKVTWSRSYPANERNLCVLAMHAGVVTTGGERVIVIDPGVGKDCLDKSPASFYQFHETKNIAEELEQLGITAEAVTDVIFTHLHFDHCGAAVQTDSRGMAKPVFPNALHWVSRAQYESERNPHPLESDSFLPGNTRLLEKASLLRIVESTIEPYPDVRLELFDGHTLGQIVATIKPDNEDVPAIVFAGDVIPLSSQVVPERISAYDLYPAQSYFGKIRMLEKAVRENQTLVFFHDAYKPSATVRKVGNSYKAV